MESNKTTQNPKTGSSKSILKSLEDNIIKLKQMQHKLQQLQDKKL